jgi:hypothetical protein
MHKVCIIPSVDNLISVLWFDNYVIDIPVISTNKHRLIKKSLCT